MSYPKVYIIILNWNGLKDTLECLESVFKLDYPNFEVIVVDNGSTDNSVEVIRKTYPQVILIENKENLGYTGGNNVGMRYALKHGADYVWLLNNDTVVEPDSLTKLVMAAEKSPNIGLVSPVIYYYDERDKIQFCGADVDCSDFLLPTYRNSKSRLEQDIKESVFIWGTALLIRRDLIEKVGFLDDKYFAYGEDNDYSLRVARLGYINVVILPAAIYHKESRATAGEKAPLQVFLRVRNLYFLWMDNVIGFKKIKYFFKYLAYAISFAAIMRDKKLNESADAAFDGAWSAIRGVGGPWDKRIKMPSILKKVFSWYPYFWVALLRGDFITLFSKILKSVKLKVINCLHFFIKLYLLLGALKI